jgi:hypothetical protein
MRPTPCWSGQIFRNSSGQIFRNHQQILTLNKDELERLAATLPARLINRVDAGLRWFLMLDT